MHTSNNRIYIEINKYLQDKFLKKEIPLFGEVIKLVDNLNQQYDLTKPIFDKDSLKVQTKEPSSISKFNTTIGLARENLQVLYESLKNTQTTIDNNYNNYINRYQLLINKLKVLESRLKTLLISKSLSSGYFRVIDESLTSFENIDIDNTDIALDLNSHTGTISPNNDTTVSLGKRLLFLATNDNVKYGVINKNKLISEGPVGDQTPINAFDLLEKPWLHKIVYAEPSSMLTSELKVNFGEPKTITKIQFDKYMPGEVGAASLQIMYSLNGSSYLHIPTTQKDFLLSDNLIAVFTPIKCQFVKFLITKHYHDEKIGNYYHYYVGANNIGFYDVEFKTEGGNVFQSKPLSLQDAEGNTLNISQITCEACHSTDEFNTISYSLSFDSGASFYPISPSNIENPEHPVILYPSDGVLTELSELVVINEDNFSLYNYEGKQNIHNLILTGCDITEALAEDIVLYRNVGKQGWFEYNEDPLDPIFVYKFGNQGIPPGWTFDGTNYRTVIVVKESSGLNINLGPNHLYLNGFKKTGSINIPVGVHEVLIPGIYFEGLSYSGQSQPFKVKEVLSLTADNKLRASIYNIAESTGVYTFTADIQDLYDPYYPYNPRLLIEGLVYNKNYEGDVVPYYGVDLFAAYKCLRKDSLDYFTNSTPTQYNIYSAVQAERIIDNVGFPLKTIVLKSTDDILVGPTITQDTVIPRNREWFTLQAKFQNSSLGATTVIVKATLNSTNNSSPLFFGYRLRIGTQNVIN